jgi:hypothetical protein
MAAPAAEPTDSELEAAIEALSAPGRLREAESVVARAAPRLQLLLAEALDAGGWFGDQHESEVRRASEIAEGEERASAVRTLLAEEARMGMMVGVAVGWALADELAGRRR